MVLSAYPQFQYVDGKLFCEGVDLADLAERHGTPLYVYSAASMTARYQALRDAFGDEAHICYAVKSNSNLSILRHFHELGSGFDLVSGGELKRLQAAGIPSSTAVFAGVGKEEWEIREALQAGILFFNIESEYELPILESVGRELGEPVRVAVRLNPDVQVSAHEYVATGRKKDKFGLDLATAASVVARIAGSSALELVGYHVHLGSTLRSIKPYLEAFERVSEFMDGAGERRAGLRYYDLGGGFGVGYGDLDGLLDVRELGQQLVPRITARGLRPVLEPGRYLSADAGILLSRVLGQKQSADQRFLLVDAAMNDLIRPALYGAHHPMVPVRETGGRIGRRDVVGPICESGDFLGKQCELPDMQRGDLLAIFAAGAYGFCMASNYNTRRRPAEVLVDGQAVRLIRRRESFADLWSLEEGA